MKKTGNNIKQLKKKEKQKNELKKKTSIFLFSSKMDKNKCKKRSWIKNKKKIERTKINKILTI